MNIVKLLGNQGPNVLLVLSLYLLFNNSNYLLYYISGYVINFIINTLLKLIIQEPRPFINSQLIELAKQNSTFFIDKEGTSYSIYGMPSGHAQSVMFSLVFIYFVLNDNKNKEYYLAIYILISLFTFYERVETDVHSIEQVVIGAICGVLVGYFFIKYTNFL